MTREDTIAGSAGAACVVLGPVIVRAVTEHPDDRFLLSFMIAGMVVATLHFGLRKR